MATVTSGSHVLCTMMLSFTTCSCFQVFGTNPKRCPPLKLDFPAGRIPQPIKYMLGSRGAPSPLCVFASFCHSLIFPTKFCDTDFSPTKYSFHISLLTVQIIDRINSSNQ